MIGALLSIINEDEILVIKTWFRRINNITVREESVRDILCNQYYIHGVWVLGCCGRLEAIIMIKDKVSIIIPTFRGEETVARAVKSALEQDYDSIEVIVVDDNEPNSEHRIETEKQLGSFLKNNQIQLIKHDSNMNGSVARNTGARVASGEYLSFLDDDDEYLPTRISKSIDRAKEDRTDLVFSNVLVKKNNKPSRLINVKEVDDWFLETLMNENIIGTGSNLFVKKKIYDELGGFDENLVRNQDVEFLLNAFSKDAIAVCINEILVIKHENDELHVPSYGEMCSIKQYLKAKYNTFISAYSIETVRAIVDRAHRSLLKNAIQNKNQEGIYTEKEMLVNKLSIKELVEIAMVKNTELSFLRKIYDKYRAIKISSILLLSKLYPRKWIE
jgi:glycosyltransferase involved in cell wall biosynthesis